MGISVRVTQRSTAQMGPPAGFAAKETGLLPAVVARLKANEGSIEGKSLAGKLPPRL